MSKRLGFILEITGRNLSSGRTRFPPGHVEKGLKGGWGGGVRRLEDADITGLGVGALHLVSHLLGTRLRSKIQRFSSQEYPSP